MAEEQRTFAESPFNPVDSLVFATLAYFNYEVAPGVDLASPDGVLLHDVVMLSDWEALTRTAGWRTRRTPRRFCTSCRQAAACATCAPRSMPTSDRRSWKSNSPPSR
ncbi:MAG: hypothetical protein ACLR3C_10460 [Eggerthella lenta]